ncbi:SP_1767 family glycosyltransferase [Chryseobacterium wangxinyae]|uniref:SP_1767 family glycosyltransferase n=1 Tax=Chryseobacterium sp. CY353 TaxID=2997334 RepID=UPI00226D81B9|nr:SP_1767 family glycosyltransferase [Chryseobacterium sp. CY353]MCY0969561.1 SP_1767 family glycosyltransferase [Chryseobacterium sp. CY353]
MNIKKKISYKFYFLQWLWKTKNLRKDFPKYNVLSIEATIEKIIKEKISISRFGDGEFRLTLPDYTLVFQDGGERIKKRLQEVLKSNQTNHIVCLPFEHFRDFDLPTKYWWYKFLNIYGNRIKFFIPTNKTYGNVFITRFYIGFADKSEKRITAIVSHLKKIWVQQDILIIEGKYSRLGVGNDLFDSARSLQRIVCPPKNAFEHYHEILQATEKHGKDKLVLLALGPTATILAYDLAKKGFWALDVGHIDIEYMWFLMKAKDKIPVEGRHVNEANEQKSLEIPEEFREQYLKSIIIEIGN